MLWALKNKEKKKSLKKGALYTILNMPCDIILTRRQIPFDQLNFVILDQMDDV